MITKLIFLEMHIKMKSLKKMTLEVLIKLLIIRLIQHNLELKQQEF